MKFSLIIVAFSSFLFSECLEGEGISCIECLEYSDSAVDGWECIIDATNWDEWVYISFDYTLMFGGSVLEDAIDTPGWDIACRRFNFRTNSGLSGVGNGGAYVDSVNTWTTFSSFNQLTQVPENSYFERDRIVNNFYNPNEHEMYLPGVANPSLETWAWVDENNEYHVAPTDNQFIIRSGTGDKFYKFWPNSYYENSDESGLSGKIRIFFNEIDPCSLSHDDCGECGGDNSSCSGCTDSTACNYDIMANINQGCEYPLEDYDCDGLCIGNDNDNDGICNDDDICPYNWDPGQNDSDNDESADACDDNDDDDDGFIDCWNFAIGEYPNTIYWDSLNNLLTEEEVTAFAASGIDSDGNGCGDYALTIDDIPVVNQFSLSQNYPNPFNPSTLIEYSISVPSNIIIDIVDLNGRNILTLDKGFKNAGSYVVSWDGNNRESQRIPSGMYIYKLILNGVERESRKMLLIY